MCGLAGFLAKSSCDATEARQLLARMGKSIFHRGPDQGAEWIDAEAGVGLVSRRLAIIDISAAGDQPMHSASGRYVISYNGETYNHRELRSELEAAGKAPQWRGTSDTETLLAGIEAWGLADTLGRAVGMFALALWDKADRTLYLARDRVGEKPLYYGWQGRGQRSVFLFGSELKALACHPAFEDEIDRDALAGYMTDGYIAAPRSIYRNIFKLRPGAIVSLDSGCREPVLQAYWSAADAIRTCSSNRLALSDDEAVDELEAVLARAVSGQLISDVPIGALLSGGIDSSLIVALMQRASSSRVQTFTIGMQDERFDEAPYARKVAEHLGTDHRELVISANDALAIVPKLPGIYDEPFADSSQIPTFLVSQLARGRVTVALSGDGGDELFSGYSGYVHAARFWRRIKSVPLPLRAATGTALRSVPPQLWNRLAHLAKIDRPHSTFADQVNKGAKLLGAQSPAEVGRGISSRWGRNAIVIGGDGDQGMAPVAALGPVETLMAQDFQRYLPDDILVKVDRAAMAVSLETRAPFLDHRVVEFAWRLPLDQKMRSNTTKWILRALLERHLPKTLFDRPKRGFGVPVDEWLRGPLKGWAQELLAPTRLRAEGYLRPEIIGRAWDLHSNRQSNRQAQLWAVLMFQAWLDGRRECAADRAA